MGHYHDRVGFFATTGNMAAFDGNNDGRVIWQEVAGLNIAGSWDSVVHHHVSGNIRGTFEENGTYSVADFLFRVVDQDNRIVCSRRIQWVEDNANQTLPLLFPFSFQCFDLLQEGGSLVYRLQADLLDERNALNNNLVFLENVDWSATVFSTSPTNHDLF